MRTHKAVLSSLVLRIVFLERDPHQEIHNVGANDPHTCMVIHVQRS